MDAMIIHAEATPECSSSDARDASAKELAHHVKSTIGVSSKVQIHEPQGVARSQGKAQRVVDNRPKE